jgi:glyoxylase-like metal-dependent hydrolase (beta-lactamase superfamily II)
MEIIEGIHRVDEASSNMAHVNVYVSVYGQEIVVIDTGTPGNAQKIVAYIQKMGLQPSWVKTIVLTHSHIDHIGSAKELKEFLPTPKLLSTKMMLTLFQARSPYLSQKTSCLEPFPLS